MAKEKVVCPQCGTNWIQVITTIGPMSKSGSRDSRKANQILCYVCKKLYYLIGNPNK